MPYRGRFAPSPSGALHFGSLVAAVGSWLRARAHAGVWLVRIEDLDPPRELAGAADAIVKTLAAFGMQSDEAIVYQSQRRDAYEFAFERLREAGQVFACACSRSDLESFGGFHRGACIALADRTRSTAWRVRAPATAIAFNDALQGMQSQHLLNEVGDFVIRRVDDVFAYQLAVVVDDEFQGITEVVRGADLLDSTARQIYLQQLLGYATPDYVHLPLAVDDSGRKLSKQDQARPVDGHDPLPALHEALRFLGLPVSPRDTQGNVSTLLAWATREFDLARVPQFCVLLRHASSDEI